MASLAELDRASGYEAHENPIGKNLTRWCLASLADFVDRFNFLSVVPKFCSQKTRIWISRALSLMISVPVVLFFVISSSASCAVVRTRRTAARTLRCIALSDFGSSCCFSRYLIVIQTWLTPSRASAAAHAL